MNANVNFNPQCNPSLIKLILDDFKGDKNEVLKQSKSCKRPRKNDKVKIIGGKFASLGATGTVLDVLTSTNCSLIKLDNDVYENTLFVNNEDLHIIEYIKQFDKTINNSEQIKVKINGKEITIMLHDGTRFSFQSKNDDINEKDILIAYYSAKIKQLNEM